jgi:hypothetical protein
MNTVVVACKIPAGLILEVGSVAKDTYRRVEIAGPNTTYRTGQNTGLIVGGYAFTTVPADLWAEFVRTRSKAAFLQNRAVYAEDTMDKAHAAALTDSKTLIGFERLNPDKPAEGLEADKDHLKVVKAQAAKLNVGLPE